MSKGNSNHSHFSCLHVFEVRGGGAGGYLFFKWLQIGKHEKVDTLLIDLLCPGGKVEILIKY